VSAETIVGLVLAHGYVLLFVAILIDAAGFPVAGEAVLVLTGMLSRNGGLELPVVIAVGVVAAVLGHSVGYGLGRFAAGRLLRTACLPPGGLAIVFGRFLVGARVAIPPLSGHARTPYPRFVALDGLGAFLWVGALVLVGYAGGPGPANLRALLGLL
jgi:membrane protein DedA with SNARE-associated domain